MIKVNGIDTTGNQSFTILLQSGATITLTLEYKPLQIGWFVGVSYLDFNVNVLRVTRSDNILAQFAHLLPFGLACFTSGGQEPFFLEDFVTGNAALCVLDADDLNAWEEFLAT